jgi:hypothetical protein
MLSVEGKLGVTTMAVAFQKIKGKLAFERTCHQTAQEITPKEDIKQECR